MLSEKKGAEKSRILSSKPFKAVGLSGGVGSRRMEEVGRNPFYEFNYKINN